MSAQTGQGESTNLWGDCDHGVVMDLEHVALGWCVRFAGQIISRTVKGAGCAHCISTRLIQPCFQHGETIS